MKKITILLPDDVDFVIGDIFLKEALEFKMERIESTETGPRRKVRHHVQRLAGMNIEKAIGDHYAAEGQFTKQTAEKWLEKLGYARSSASAALFKLKDAGFIEKVGSDRYKWVKPYGQTV